MNQNIKGKGEQRLQVYRNGKLRVDTGFQPNMILDRLFSRLSATSSDFSSAAGSTRCKVGSGTTPPAPTDVSLESELATVSTQGVSNYAFEGNMGSDVAYSMTRVIPFPEGAVIGNVSEVGTTVDSSSNNLDTRALVKDIGGNPTTLILTIQDQLVVTHKLTWLLPLANLSGNITLDSIVYGWEISRTNESSTNVINSLTIPSFMCLAAMAAGAWGNYARNNINLPAVPGGTGSGQSTGLTADTPTIVRTQVDTFTGQIELTWDAQKANLNIAGWLLGTSQVPYTGGEYMIKFTPAIPKTNVQKLVLRYRRVWGRV